MNGVLRYVGETEETDFSVPKGTKTYIYTFTDTYLRLPKVFIDGFRTQDGNKGKPATVTITNIDVKITFTDAGGRIGHITVIPND